MASAHKFRFAGSLLAAAALSGCGQGDVIRDPYRANVIVLSLDTLRADRLGVYGNQDGLTPFLDDLAEGGVVMDRCIASATWTLPSHWTLFLGQHQSSHGVWTRSSTYDGAQPTMAEVFQAADYETAAFVGGGFVSSEFGFASGFDTFDEQSRSGLGELMEYLPRLEEWVARPRAHPFFLFLQMYDVHRPYTPALEDLALVRPDASLSDLDHGKPPQGIPGDAWDPDTLGITESLYDAEVRVLDTALKDLFSTLDENGLLDNTLVVVTSDHGEAFMEHGWLGHGSRPYQELVHIPWILSGPGLARGTRVSGPVALADIEPTIMGIVGVPDPGERDGRDLSSLMSGSDPNRVADKPVFAEMIGPEGSFDALAVHQGEWTLLRVEGMADSLFHTALDPLQQHNLAAKRPRALQHLSKVADQWIRTHTPRRSAGLAALHPFLRRVLEQKSPEEFEDWITSHDPIEAQQMGEFLEREGTQEDDQLEQRRLQLIRQLHDLGYLEDN